MQAQSITHPCRYNINLYHMVWLWPVRLYFESIVSFQQYASCQGNTCCRTCRSKLHVQMKNKQNKKKARYIMLYIFYSWNNYSMASKRTSNAENVSIWWRHRAEKMLYNFQGKRTGPFSNTRYQMNMSVLSKYFFMISFVFCYILRPGHKCRFRNRLCVKLNFIYLASVCVW